MPNGLPGRAVSPGSVASVRTVTRPVSQSAVALIASADLTRLGQCVHSWHNWLRDCSPQPPTPGIAGGASSCRLQARLYLLLSALTP
ncbi:MAG TPA: hypothetical protein VIQ11_04930 [Mycobacterium sp.]